MSDTNTRWGVWYNAGDSSGWCGRTGDPHVYDTKEEADAEASRANAKASQLDPRCKYSAKPLPSTPTPPATVEGDGPWIIEQVGDECLLHNPTLSVAEVRTFKVSRNGITWLRDILNKQHAESKRLREALEAMVAMAAPNVYPQPDKENSNWATLERARTALAGGAS
jgi:hypothetical protein